MDHDFPVHMAKASFSRKMDFASDAVELKGFRHFLGKLPDGVESGAVHGNDDFRL